MNFSKGHQSDLIYKVAYILTSIWFRLPECGTYVTYSIITLSFSTLYLGATVKQKKHALLKKQNALKTEILLKYVKNSFKKILSLSNNK